MSSADKCWECEKENVPLHNHHPVPRVRGGTKTIPLCEECHSKAHHMDKNMNTSALIREGLKKTMESGTKVGRPKYGYFAGGEGKINPDEMVVVQKIKKMKSEGVVFREILDALKAEGFKTRKGTNFTIPQVHRILNYDYGADLEEDNET